MAGRTLDAGRVLRALRYSYAGLRAVFLREAAFRQELILAAVLVPVAVWLGDDGVERALMIGALLLVLIVELLNSAVETVIDRFGTESPRPVRQGEGHRLRRRTHIPGQRPDRLGARPAGLNVVDNPEFRSALHCIRINDRWRVCFEWPQSYPGPANVEIVDYH